MRGIYLSGNKKMLIEKRYIFRGNVIIFCLLLSWINLFSQWQPELRLTNDSLYSAASDNNAWSVAASGDTIHVVWTSAVYISTFSEIYYKRSTDGGLTWEANILIANQNSPGGAAVSVSGKDVHIIWSQSPSNQHYDIYYRRSTDGGGSWLPPVAIFTGGESLYQSISSSGPVVIVTWAEDLPNNTSEIYVRNSTTGGNSWGSATRLTNIISIKSHPSASISGLNVNVVWQDDRDANINESEIFLKRSTTGGNSWGPDTRLTSASGYSWHPSTASIGSTVHVVWEDRRNGLQSHDIYYKRSTDFGVSWGNDIRISSTTAAQFPSVSAEGNNVHIIWQDSPFFDNDIHHRYSVNNGSSWQNTLSLTFDAEDQEGPTVSVSGSVVHTVWTDYRHRGSNNNAEIYYRRNPFGSTIFYTCSGTVKYKDNNQPVTRGYAKALRYKYQTAEIQTVDSAAILSDGTYTFTGMPRGDTLYIMYYQIGDTLDFVPGYYVSTTDWQQASKIIPLQNLNNTNGLVDRINNTSGQYIVSGQVYQNGPSDAATIPLKDAIIYVLQGSVYKNFGITNSIGQYTAAKLAPGTYTFTSRRLGFAPVTQNVTITNSNLQNIDFNFGSPIAVEVISAVVPKDFSLSQNYPNPFNPTTNLKFSVPEKGLVNLTIYDALGRIVETLVNSELNPGTYKAGWSATGGAKNYPSGVYFYKLTTGEFSETKKMVLLK